MSGKKIDDPPKAAILDMDGLMLDTEGPTLRCWLEAGRSLGYDIPLTMITRAIGITETSTRALFLGEYGRDFPFDTIHQKVTRLIKQTIEREGIRHRPGLAAFLDCLAEKGIPFAVATSSERKMALRKLKKAGIRERFSVIVCGDDVKNGKPAPDVFLAAAEQLGASPADCVGFEDSGPGLLGLAAAGMRSVFIRDIPEPSPRALAGVWRQYKDLALAREIFN
ncbi:MAG: HAD family phosphatase [Treponema sp.]|jgi:HAD superfamily hydrolase (TIGR01509 family)|nr:HAD family phosphatase [Treponema sp.]